MALDISKIKSALTRVEGSGPSTTQSDLVKLPKGDHVIRIVPYHLDMAMPFRELQFHYGIARQNFLCPKTMGNECPICDFAWEVWNEFKQKNDESYKDLFKTVINKKRIYVPVIVKESPDSSILYSESNKNAKWWGIAEKTYEEILGEVVAADAENIDITDVNNGLDINVKMDTFMGRSDRFTVKSIKAARRQSPLIDGTAEEIDALIKSTKNIDEIFEYKPLQDMKEALAKHANPNQTVDEESKGTERDFSSKDEDSKEEKDDIANEVDKKFAEFMGDDN